MKILFVIDSLVKGGKERRLIELVKGMLSNKIEFRLVLLTPIIEFEEIDKLKIKPIIIKRIIKKDPLVFLKLYKICKKFKPDVINTWGLMPSFYSFPIAKFLKISFVNSMIIDSPKKLNIRTRFLSSIIFPFSDIIASNSYSGLRSYNIKSDSAVVIYNGFDFNRINQLDPVEEVRDRFKITTKYIVGMVAGFRYHKDHKTLLKAAKIILKERNDVTFLLVGDGPTINDCREYALGFKNIIFTGNCSNVESIMNICDIGILSTYTEGISNSIMEFMALGKPVIATDGGGTKEIVADEETGLLVPVRSPVYLSEKINLLLNNKELREKMGLAGKGKIINEFSIKKMISEYIKLFKNAIIQN